jgi:Ca2+-transporting ATPase
LESCPQSPVSPQQIWGSLQSLITGPEIEALDDGALAERAKAASVFARVSPEHKVRIVGAFKRNGHVVAMTGDGVNDAPALKRADIGIAMGITGTDVSKETADMVLTDDNFASIVRAVAQGRVVYANIRKFVYFLLCGNLAEIAVVLLTTLVGIGNPLTAIQLLWLNLMTDGAPALALGLEKGEPDVMRQPPRPAHQPILTQQLLGRMALQAAVMALVVLGVYGWALQHHPAQANTMAFVTLSLSQLPLAYTARSERFSIFQIGLFGNRKMQQAVLLSLVGMLAVVYVPFLNPIFGTLPLSPTQWVWVLPAALAPAVVAEGVKAIGRHSNPAPRS